MTLFSAFIKHIYQLDHSQKAHFIFISTMQDQDSPAKKKEKDQDKKSLLNTLSQSINPILKQLNQDDNVLQMPELALRCAQYFQSISQYCMGYYKNYKNEEEVRKTKMIKKQEKEKKEKGSRGRGRKRGEDKQTNEKNQNNTLEPPKKPLTAYIIYFQDKKQNFVERYPSLNLSELTKLIAKEWKELSESEKQVFLIRASQDRKRYEEQMIEFKRLYGKNYDNIDSFSEKERPPEEAELEAIINQQDNVLIEEPMDEENNEKNNEEEAAVEIDEDEAEEEAQEDEEEGESDEEEGGEDNEGEEQEESEAAEEQSESVIEEVQNGVPNDKDS